MTENTERDALIAEAREWPRDGVNEGRLINGPGRALDIEVDWEPSACCSVCADGVGDITQEDDGLRCHGCGTTWDMDGTGGETTDGPE